MKHLKKTDNGRRAIEKMVGMGGGWFLRAEMFTWLPRKFKKIDFNSHFATILDEK